MTVSTVYSGTADGHVFSFNATWLTARSGSNLSADNTAVINNAGIAHDGIFGYSCYEFFVSFDTSAITGTVSAATLSMYGDGANVPVTASVLEARTLDWGATVTTADYVAGASVSGTILASKTSGSWSTSAYNDMTFTTSGVTTSGTTRLMLCTDLFRGTSAPASNTVNYFGMASADDTTASNGKDPKLVVTWSLALPFFPQNIVTRQASRRASSW